MKFKIKDENGKEFEVEEIKEQDEEAPAEQPKPAEESHEDVHDDEALSKDEISALKELAAMAPALKKLLEVERKEHAGDEAEPETHDDEPAGEDKPEEVVDTCHDSTPGTGSQASKAAGSIETKPTTQDSVNSVENALEVEDAWAKRYSSKKEDAE